MRGFISSLLPALKDFLLKRREGCRSLWQKAEPLVSGLGRIGLKITNRLGKMGLRRVLYLAIPIGLVLLSAIFLVVRSRLRTPQALYREAQSAPPKRAVDIYKRLEADLPQIKEYFRLGLAQGTMPDIDAFSELQAIIAFRPHSPAAYEAHLTLARYYADIGEERAEEEYLSALELEDSVPLRLELAHYYEERGDPAEAYAEYLRLLSDRHDAFVGMRRMGSDAIEVASDLNRCHYFSDALETLRLVKDPEATGLRARALAGLKHYEEALEAYREHLAQEPEDQDAQLGLADVLKRMGEREEALEAYRAIDTPESRLAQAELLEEERPSEALDLYLSSPYPVAWWNATKLLESQGRRTKALSLYERLAKTDTYFADDSAYRMFILAERLGNEEARNRALALLEGFQPDFLAMRALGLELAMAPPFKPAAMEVVEKADALESLGLSDLAHRELVMAAKFSSDPDVDFSMAEALSERGFVLDSQPIAEGLLRELDRAPLSLWRLSYPKAYLDEVQKAATEFDVSPLLILAMMREESRYDPEAISWAGATGLMQILPSTGDWIAEQLGEEVTPGDIFDSLTNARFGAWFLRFLLDHFEGDLELAVTAYNGGAASVESWQEDPMVRDREDFLRWIGFGETREYVQRVLLSHRVYQRLQESE
ncbi:MAG: transglycosylase SLT domain-containing protein [Chloroflexota bacterium]|nr:transglycosylase SLT domain-containing protein [Chloroflexota bacterium]